MKMAYWSQTTRECSYKHVHLQSLSRTFAFCMYIAWQRMSVQTEPLAGKPHRVVAHLGLKSGLTSMW